MESISIESQEVMDKFLLSGFWSGHPFIREVYAISPSYKSLDGKGTINPDVPIEVRFLILTDDQEHPGVELVFEETEKMAVSFVSDFKLRGTVNEDRLGHKSIHFSFDSNLWVMARRMKYRLLGKEVLGNYTKYGFGADLKYLE